MNRFILRKLNITEKIYSDRNVVKLLDPRPIILLMIRAVEENYEIRTG
jgi:hypothetical protein